MSRDSFTRLLAIAAIVVAIGFSYFRPLGGGGGGGPRNGLMGKFVRWIVYCAVEEEFRNAQPQDPGVLLQENARPQRPVGSDGAPQLDHGRGW